MGNIREAVKGTTNVDRAIVVAFVAVAALTTFAYLEPMMNPCTDLHMCTNTWPDLATFAGYPALVAIFFLMVVRFASPGEPAGKKGQLGDARLPPPP